MDRRSVNEAWGVAITELAEGQHGVIAAAQLYSLGLSETQVRTRARNGLLHRIHHGVYAVGRRSLPTRGHWMAALLACRGDALLSHQSAAELWGIRRPTLGRKLAPPIEVTVVSQGSRSRPGIRVHRCRALPVAERATHDRIPVTSPDRTILDLAWRLPRRQLERAVDEAERLRLCDEKDLRLIVKAHKGERGCGAVRRLLDEHAVGSTRTRNDFEEAFLSLCRRHRLPQPEVNVPLLDYVVDFLWREAGLVVEVDGRATHGTRRAFQADRDRDGRLAVAGYRVLRFTWWDVTRRPAVVADRVRRMLG